jgi:hypothetical protein
VKKHTAKLRKETLLYKGHVQRFATAVQNDLPMASAQLDGLLDRLQKYVALDVPESVRSSASTETAPEASVTQVTGSMSRGEAPEAEEQEGREEDKPQANPPVTPG